MASIGFGTWSWGNQFLWNYSSKEDDELLETTFHEAISRGLDFIDTADSYGTGLLNGRSEELLGGFLKKLTPSEYSKVCVATKLAPYPWRLGRNGFKSAFQASKVRLQGKIDRVQLHWSTARYAPWQEVVLMDGLGDLVENGLIPEIGISNMGPSRLNWFYYYFKERGIPLRSIQIQFSLLAPNYKKFIEIRTLCKKLDIQLLAYSPLALGFLSVPSESKSLMRSKKISFLRNRLASKILPASFKLRKELELIASRRKVSQTQVALNWCRSYGAIPIVGLRDPDHAKDAGQAQRWELTKKERNRLDELSQACTVKMPNNPFQSD